MCNQELVAKMFTEKHSAYNIHLELDIPIKQVYHYISIAEKKYAVASKERYIKRIQDELEQVQVSTTVDDAQI